VANKPLNTAMRDYAEMAFLLPSSTVAGYFIGYLLDKAFGTHFLYLVFLLLGSVGGIVQLVRQVKRMMARDDG
jgi:F0F1-type ATP synthase assembly protein I